MVASLVLNVLVIVVILRRKTALRTNHSTLILHMMLSELGLTVVCMPLTVLSIFDNGATLKGSMILCMMNGFTSFTFPTSYTLLLSCIAIDRYFAICKAVHYPTILSPFRLKIVVILPKRDKIEGYYPRHNRHSNLREEDIFYRAAATSTVFTTRMSGESLHAPDDHQDTRRISENLSMSRESDGTQSPGENEYRRERQQKIERRVALTGAILILTHYACWVPYSIIFGGAVHGLPSWAVTLVMWVAYCSTIVCPVVYALTHKQIIRGIHRMCLCAMHSTE
ncbi:octopamine receptor beta-1R-like [Branchiostoma floridae]|uniref:Octopamine receptor beta-1R-like n=1 Tax=Branchiostoma floridae TaxID=7739 RepID=A0A9J7HMU4_BRAFL|nr:octopamine receptor beta-1R-like [Branchiostoma floridae]